MRISLILLFTVVCSVAFGQNTFRVRITDKESGVPLPGATALVERTSQGAAADENGHVVIADVPAGESRVSFSFVGYETHVEQLTFPLAPDTILLVGLTAAEELEEVVILSTRSTRTFADIPTRVELIAGEELEEKGNMKPGDIRMLLNESTGIQTQQTSATSANASIRIQGLDGRYTQILKDGFPLYAGYSGGLGLLQTPPLDLQQVEVIKGSSSTLYGGGAIAGLVNLISKRPSEERDLRFWMNGTTAKGLDLSTFYGEQWGKTGITVFASRNSNKSFDPAGIGLSAIPDLERYTFTPKLFFDLGENSHLDIGLNYTTEARNGGDMLYLDGKGDATHSYFEKNNSRRTSSQLSFVHEFSESKKLTVRNSLNHFTRTIQSPGYTFDGTQSNTFTEVNYSVVRPTTEWVGGLNLWTEDFSERQLTTTPLRDYQQNTIGAFVQNTLNVSSKFILESGLRGDYVVDYGFLVLPRASLLFKPSPAFSSRIGGGLGYKAPTIFTEESERLLYRQVLPVSPSANTLERSYGANWDFNYQTSVADGEIGISVNQLFFYTHITNPLFLQQLPSTDYALVNISGNTETRGAETNLKFEYHDFKLFIGYTFTDAAIEDNGVSRQPPLTARHRLNNVLMYEVEERWKIGVEAYYFSPQLLSDGLTGKEYWICGFMAEKIWERFSLYVNFENFLDTRQTRFDTIYTGTITNPVFRDIYAPVDGFVVNGGLKVKL